MMTAELRMRFCVDISPKGQPGDSHSIPTQGKLTVHHTPGPHVPAQKIAQKPSATAMLSLSFLKDFGLILQSKPT